MPGVRDTTSRHDLCDCSRKIRRLTESISKKMARFHDGRWVIAFASLSEDKRSSAIRKRWRVSSSDDALASAFEEYLETYDHQSRPPDPSGNDPDELLVMPGNAEKRAKKTRNLLALWWANNVAGTEFEGTKQMYKICALHPNMLPDWWSSATGGAPFRNTSLYDADVSEAVFRYLAPILHSSAASKTRFKRLTP